MIQVQVRIVADSNKKKPKLTINLDILKREDANNFENSMAADIEEMFCDYFNHVSNDPGVKQLWKIKINRISEQEKTDENTNSKTNS